MEATLPELSSLTILNDLRDRLAALTPEEMAAYERKLLRPMPAGHTVVGEIGPTLRRMFALCAKLMIASNLESLKSAAADNVDIEREKKEKSVLLSILGNAFKEIFWAQVKVDLAVYRPAHLAIYEGWIIADGPCTAGGHEGIINALFGGLPK